jgi:hypothetical protein
MDAEAIGVLSKSKKSSLDDYPNSSLIIWSISSKDDSFALSYN